MCGIRACIHRRGFGICPSAAGSGGDLLHSRGSDSTGSVQLRPRKESNWEIHLQLSRGLRLRTSGLLHPRGSAPQPVADQESGNVLCWNGEVFLHRPVTPGSVEESSWCPLPEGASDTAWVLDLLTRHACPHVTHVQEAECSCHRRNSSGDSGPEPEEKDERDDRNPASLGCSACCHAGAPVPELLERHVRGPFALVFWQAGTNRLWYGKDVFGRRSLLAGVRRQDAGGKDGCGVVISSLASDDPGLDWEEIQPTGMFVFSFPIPPQDASVGQDSTELIPQHVHWEAVREEQRRTGSTELQRVVRCAQPHSSPVYEAPRLPSELLASATDPFEIRRIFGRSHPAPALGREECFDEASATERLLDCLRRGVAARVHALDQDSSCEPVAILFSGGLDCVVLAGLVHETLAMERPVELINVAYAGPQAREEPRAVVCDCLYCGRQVSEYWSDLGSGGEERKGREELEFQCARGAPEIHSQIPDRAAAANSLCELRECFPDREWRLVEVDVYLEELELHRGRIQSLIAPKQTVMDFNIGSILWFGAQGRGRLRSDPSTYRHLDTPLCNYARLPSAAVGEEEGGKEEVGGRRKLTKQERRKLRKQQALAAAERDDQDQESGDGEATSDLPVYQMYRCRSRILLSGLGADELMGGYTRHRTLAGRLQSLINPSSSSSTPDGGEGGRDEKEVSQPQLSASFYSEILSAELRVDTGRLWERNLGRDDRVLSDSGRVPRYPFLDAEVVKLCTEILPLEVLYAFHAPPELRKPGVMDKAILRRAASTLGLRRVSRLVKRAMQFGTRIANKHVPGHVLLSEDMSLRDLVNPR